MLVPERRKLLFFSLTVLIVVGLSYFGHVLRTNREWGEQHRKVEAMLSDLRSSKPKDSSQYSWNQAVERTIAAFSNIAFSQTYISVSELSEFRRDLAIMIADTEPSPLLFWAIYDRLSRCNETTRNKGQFWRDDFAETMVRSFGRDGHPP